MLPRPPARPAVKPVVEPVFEADLESNAYGYRPKRSARDAVKKVHEHLIGGHTDVVDADLSKYFDTIPHADPMKCVAKRVFDRRVPHFVILTKPSPTGDWLCRRGIGPGRNESCPCGSGLKFKRCCLDQRQFAAAA